MISLKKLNSRQPTGRQGFTIVELLIVIVVIGILAALVIVTYSGIQKRARDTERKTDVKGIQGQLEAYWADSAKYPTLAEANDATATTGFRAVNFKGLPAEAFADPKNASSQQLCASTASNCYGYSVTPALCDNSATSCDNYTLTATLESGGTFTVQSNN